MSRKPIPSSKKYFFGLFWNNGFFRRCESTCFSPYRQTRALKCNPHCAALVNDLGGSRSAYVQN